MKLLHYGFLLVGAALGLAACSEDNPWMNSDGEGGILPLVNADSHVKDAIPTRATAMTPDVQEFGLKLTKADGQFTKTWDRLADFDEKQGFRSGEYTLEAFYGSIDEEGFEKPCYKGAAQVVVKPGEQTEVAVTATLANSMVSIDYTDAFKNYFADYQTSLHSEGYGYNELPKDCPDPMYVAPGKVQISVAFTKPNGQSATVQPAEFTAEARHHYHVTLDCNNGNVGDAQLIVTFDDTVDQEEVIVDLSDELLNMPEPEVTPQGFTDGQTLQLIEHSPADSPMKFTAYVPAGIQAATFTVNSDSYTPPFGREVDLASADGAVQSQLAAAGIKVLGLFKNPDKLATVDFSGLIEQLPAGTHTITLQMKDRLTRVNAPVSVTVVNAPLELSFLSAPVCPFGSTSATVNISYNGTDPRRDITVQGLNDDGVWVDCPVTSAAATNAKARKSRSDAFPSKAYALGVTVPVTTRDIQVRIYYKGVQKATGVIKRGYAVEANAFARHAILTVKTNKESIASTVNSLRVYDGEKELGSGNITRDPANGTVTITNLKGSTRYHLYFTTASSGSSFTDADVAFTTEAEAQVENAGMENWYSEKVHSQKTLGIGEDIYRWFPNAQGSNYWGTRNATTTGQSTGTTCYYTSFSGTINSGNAAEISTLGWGKGVTFGGANDKPQVTAGMLFMGSHSYSGSETTFEPSKETFDYGRSFTSRPTSLSFDYKFTSHNSEAFKAYVVIENRAGGKTTRLAYGELVSNTNVSNFTNTTIRLNYSNLTLKATHAYIVFISSNAENPGVSKHQGSKNAFKGNSDSKYIGNVLTVDNIKFNY
ncbi:MAG: DUF4493 domain-containing protein [Porphyromonadaceae bacterium]|nr:DUF4493 domain-containing protein [Porphyromonadaceae bacterium]MDD6313842.1 DUF4493 domain-containing protein [Porphyromonadaceae bacterium]